MVRTTFHTRVGDRAEVSVGGAPRPTRTHPLPHFPLYTLYTIPIHNTQQEQHHKRPHEEPPLSLSNDRMWHSDGAYHVPPPAPGWVRPRPSQRGR